MKPAANPHSPSFAHIFSTPDYSIEYGEQPPFTLSDRRDHHSQLIILPDAANEAELHWSEPGQAGRAVWTKGPHAIYIPPGAPYALNWKRIARIVRFSFTGKFVNQSAAAVPPARVFIRREWEMAGADLMVRQLFRNCADLCSHPKSSIDHTRYLEGLGAFAACHIVSRIGGEPGAKAGLPLSLLKRVEEYIEQNYHNPILTGTLARIAGFGEHHFTRLFKARTGMTPHDYIIMKRLERVQQLRSCGMRISNAVAEVGFCDHSHYARDLREFCKNSMPPKNNADIIQGKAGFLQDSAMNTGQNGGTICPDCAPPTATQSRQNKKLPP